MIALMALLTWGFHASVNHRFSLMMAGMQEAATLTNVMRIEELVLLEEYRQSTLLHLSSRQHILDAVTEEHQAMALLGRIRTEELQSSILHDAAAKLEGEATKEEKMASDLDYASIADNLDYISSKLKGTSVAKRAQDEAAEASKRLEHADDLAEQGAELLKQAEAKLNATENPSEVIAADQGICRWVYWACSSIDRNAPPETGKKISNEAIEIAAEFDHALKLLNDASNERQYATNLLQKSSKDVNESIAILESASKFRENAEEEHFEAVELHDKAKKEEQKAKEDEIVEAIEEEEAISDKSRLITALNSMSRYVVQARAEGEDATALDYHRQQEQTAITATEMQIRAVTYAAKKQVTHAGWYASTAVLMAVGLLYLSLQHIGKTCLTGEPWLWLVRQQKLSIRDVSYVYLHFLLVILTMAFSGQLLHDYPKHGFRGKIEIIALFSLVGSFFQVALLHFLPNVIRLVSVSSLNAHTFLTLVVENVAKSGIVVFAVFILEILLCWINFGAALFTHVYKWNGYCLWGVVTVAAILHLVYFEDYSQLARDIDSTMEVRSAPTIDKEQGTELRSLVDDTPQLWDGRGGIMGDLDSASSSCTKDNNYGSTVVTNGHEFSSEISSTFISSWTAQLSRLCFLVDMVLASWSIWVVRYNVAVIFKISPLSPGIVWGYMPLWVLNLVLLTIFLASIYIFCRWRQKEHHLPSLGDARAGGEEHRSSSPLLR